MKRIDLTKYNKTVNLLLPIQENDKIVNIRNLVLEKKDKDLKCSRIDYIMGRKKYECDTDLRKKLSQTEKNVPIKLKENYQKNRQIENNQKNRQIENKAIDKNINIRCKEKIYNRKEKKENVSENNDIREKDIKEIKIKDTIESEKIENSRKETRKSNRILNKVRTNNNFNFNYKYINKNVINKYNNNRLCFVNDKEGNDKIHDNKNFVGSQIVNELDSKHRGNLNKSFERKVPQRQDNVNNLCKSKFKVEINDSFSMYLLNVRGLNKVKNLELEEILKKESECILLITETQKKYETVNHSDDSIVINQFRNNNERKGGGLMIKYLKNKDICLRKVNTISNDLLHVKGMIFGHDVNILLIYLDVRKNKQGKEHNKLILNEIKEKIIDDDKLIILGDFNAHIKELDNRPTDDNGQEIINLINNHNLTLLNMEEKCEGKFTWSNSISKTVIDYVIMSENIQKYWKYMLIDEDQNITDMSDHNMIKIDILKINNDKQRYTKKVKSECYSKKEEDMIKFRNQIISNWRSKNDCSYEILDSDIMEAMNNNLKKIFWKKEEENKIYKPWFKDYLIEEISKRRTLNKKSRKCNIKVKK